MLAKYSHGTNRQENVDERKVDRQKRVRDADGDDQSGGERDTAHHDHPFPDLSG